MTDQELVKNFIRERWDDQKRAEVLAFAEDGKMDRWNTCCCLIGVSSSENLHTNCEYLGEKDHYRQYKYRDGKLSRDHLLSQEDERAEIAYMSITKPNGVVDYSIFIRLLREVIAESEAGKTNQEEEYEVLVRR